MLPNTRNLKAVNHFKRPYFSGLDLKKHVSETDILAQKEAENAPNIRPKARKNPSEVTSEGVNSTFYSAL